MYSGTTSFSGLRLEADVVSFALGGMLVAYLLRPRWAVIQVFLSAALIYVLFYLALSHVYGWADLEV